MFLTISNFFSAHLRLPPPQQMAWLLPQPILLTTTTDNTLLCLESYMVRSLKDAGSSLLRQKLQKTNVKNSIKVSSTAVKFQLQICTLLFISWRSTFVTDFQPIVEQLESCFQFLPLIVHFSPKMPKQMGND